MRTLACSLLLLLATGCAIVPLDGGYYGRPGYSHDRDRDGHDRYDHRDRRGDDDDSRR
jgi:hypothetical protein